MQKQSKNTTCIILGISMSVRPLTPTAARGTRPAVVIWPATAGARSTSWTRSSLVSSIWTSGTRTLMSWSRSRMTWCCRFMTRYSLRTSRLGMWPLRPRTRPTTRPSRITTSLMWSRPWSSRISGFWPGAFRMWPAPFWNRFWFALVQRMFSSTFRCSIVSAWSVIVPFFTRITVWTCRPSVACQFAIFITIWLTIIWRSWRLSCFVFWILRCRFRRWSPFVRTVKSWLSPCNIEKLLKWSQYNSWLHQVQFKLLQLISLYYAIEVKFYLHNITAFFYIILTYTQYLCRNYIFLQVLDVKNARTRNKN